MYEIGLKMWGGEGSKGWSPLRQEAERALANLAPPGSWSWRWQDPAEARTLILHLSAREVAEQFLPLYQVLEESAAVYEGWIAPVPHRAGEWHEKIFPSRRFWNPDMVAQIAAGVSYKDYPEPLAVYFDIDVHRTQCWTAKLEENGYPLTIHLPGLEETIGKAGEGELCRVGDRIYLRFPFFFEPHKEPEWRSLVFGPKAVAMILERFERDQAITFTAGTVFHRGEILRKPKPRWFSFLPRPVGTGERYHQWPRTSVSVSFPGKRNERWATFDLEGFTTTLRLTQRQFIFPRKPRVCILQENCGWGNGWVVKDESYRYQTNLLWASIEGNGPIAWSSPAVAQRFESLAQAIRWADEEAKHCKVLVMATFDELDEANIRRRVSLPRVYPTGPFYHRIAGVANNKATLTSPAIIMLGPSDWCDTFWLDDPPEAF